MLKQWLTIFCSLSVLGISFGVSSVGYSCGDSCGSYGGFYDVGGYNLYNFAVDVGSYVNSVNVDISITDTYWGGGCATLYGSCGSNYSLGCGTSSNDQINALLYNQILINNSLLYGNGLNTGYPNMYQDPYMGMGSYPSPYGYGYPYNGYPMNPYAAAPLNYGTVPNIYGGGNYTPFPSYPTVNPPVSSPFPTYPISNFPSTPYTGSLVPSLQNPPTANYPTLTTPTLNSGSLPVPPSATLPYGGCDGITVPCPSGPVTRPIDLKQPPVYQPVTTQSGSDPLRYRVPRGVVPTH